MDNPTNGLPYHSQSGDNGFNYDGSQRRVVGGGSTIDEIRNFSLGWIINQFLYYKWALLYFVAGCTGLAVLLFWITQPVYQGRGTLIINSSKNQYSYAGSDISNLLTSSYGLGMVSSFNNQLATIRSRRIAEETARRVLQHPFLANGKKYPILWKNYPDDSTSIAKNTLVRRIIENLKVKRADEKADLMTVHFNSYSPQAAAALVNLVMDTYTAVSTQKNRQSATSARKFLSKQREKITDSLRASEAKLKSFQQRTGFVAAESQTSSSFKKLSQLEEEKQQQRIKLSSVNTAIRNYEAQLKKMKPAFSKSFSDNVAPLLAQLQAALSKLEAERIVLISQNPELKNYPTREPQLTKLNTKIRALKRNISQRANRILATDSFGIGFLESKKGVSRLATLQQNLAQARIKKAQIEAQMKVINKLQSRQEATMDNVPEKALRLARLKRRAEMQETLYKTITQQYAETSLWEQTQFGLGAPLDYAQVPYTPLKPNLPAYLFRGFIVGLFLGIGFIFVRTNLRTEINSPNQLSSLGYPLLSVIPDFTHNDSYGQGENNESTYGTSVHRDWITLYDSNSASAEAFRRLQNNLTYSRPDESLQTLMVSSTGKGEGKSSTTINLATPLTEAGKKVAVIDIDLRRPSVHTLTGLSKHPGLMDVIFENKTLDQCLRPTPCENLFALPVGNRPPNPSAILKSAKMNEILEALKIRFDYVLFDTPPVGILGDASPMIRYMDGVVLVSKFCKTDIGAVERLIEQLNHLQAPILGTVLTAFDSKKSANQYYHDSNYYYNYDSYENYA